ncbi:MAG: hypothetical protein ACTSRK_18595 [Promethearchaeota archaeon]
MGKSSEEKIVFAKSLLKIGVPYREVQTNLKIKFGSGMSNTTLQKMMEEEEETRHCEQKLQKCEENLQLYKQLYFDLLDAMKKKMKIE